MERKEISKTNLIGWSLTITLSLFGGWMSTDAACKSMEAETGIEVVGILGTPAIRQLGMIINLPGGIVTICK